MGSDRWLNLLNQAYIEGFLDPKEARPTDRLWQIKASWVADYIEKRNKNELRKMKHEMNAALLSYMGTENSLELHWEQAHRLQSAVHDALLPWEASEVRMTRNEFKALKDQWEAVWGKQDDPEVEREIKRTAEYLINMTTKPEKSGGRRWLTR